MLVVFHADGTYVEADTDGSTGIGVWEATGPSSFNLTFVSMSPTDEGDFEPSPTIRASGEVSEDGQTFTAEFSHRVHRRRRPHWRVRPRPRDRHAYQRRADGHAGRLAGRPLQPVRGGHHPSGYRIAGDHADGQAPRTGGHARRQAPHRWGPRRRAPKRLAPNRWGPRRAILRWLPRRASRSAGADVDQLVVAVARFLDRARAVVTRDSRRAQQVGADRRREVTRRSDAVCGTDSERRPEPVPTRGSRHSREAPAPVVGPSQLQKSIAAFR